MIIRTDFVTNSSSSCFVCEKTSTFQVTDKDGNVSDISFSYDSMEFTQMSEGNHANVQVSDIINRFLVRVDPNIDKWKIYVQHGYEKRDM